MPAYVSNVTVFDGRSVKQKAGVLVSEGRIAWVGPHARAPRSAREADEIEGRGRTLTPGLIDCHVHLCADGGPRAFERLTEVTREQLDAAVEASLRQHLAAGVTTVRDLGDQDGAVLSWRHDGGGAGLPAVFASGPPITSVGAPWQMWDADAEHSVG